MSPTTNVIDNKSCTNVLPVTHSDENDDGEPPKKTSKHLPSFKFPANKKSSFICTP